jgi:hypothetical protein
MRLIVLAAAALAAQAARAEEPTFLFDAVRLPRYHGAWERLAKEVEPKPNWLLSFTMRLEGAAGEMKPVTIDGKPYRLSYICKPEDCAGHKFEVLFEENGVKAFGALGGKDEPPAFFGNPDPAQQEALVKAIRPVAAVETPQSKSE